MHKKRSFFQVIRDNAYYIALGVCAVAVIASGILFLRDPELRAAESEVPAAAMSEVPGRPEPAAPATEPLLFAPESAAPETEAPQPETAPSKPPVSEFSASAPVAGEVLQCFCMDRLCYNPTTRDWRTHDGLDLAAETGTPVRAAAAGTVLSVYDDDLLGRTVVLRHAGGWVTHYSNLESEVPVSAGQAVQVGQEIGRVGRTALLELGSEPHLHFAVFRDNVSRDPAEFLSAAGAPGSAE